VPVKGEERCRLLPLKAGSRIDMFKPSSRLCAAPDAAVPLPESLRQLRLPEASHPTGSSIGM
jgi:hypothetical protein